ncbi:MAG: FlgD immunoglobulin-like domain containing protein [bacterium]
MKKQTVLSVVILLLFFTLLAPEFVNAQEEKKILAEDGSAEDRLGKNIAIDFPHIVAGAPYDDNENGTDAGAVYVFDYDYISNSFVQKAKLLPDDGEAEDLFGYSVDIYHDYLVVGACWDDDAGEKSGAAYIFHLDENDNWVQQAKLTADDAGEDNRFGISSAIYRKNVIVGAFFDDDNGYRSGSAYIFKRDNESWHQQVKLTASDAEEKDWFGVNVSIDHDYASVGSRYDDNENGIDAGAVYIFKRENDTWSQDTKLIATDGAGGDRFETNCLFDDRLVVGAPRDDDNGDNSGSAYVYRRTGGTWFQEAKLTSADGAAGDLFGTAISMYGNLIAVSAPSDDDKGTSSGSVYLFRYNGTSWNEMNKIIASDGDEGDGFGCSVDVNSIGEIVIGAQYEDDNDQDAGSVYHYWLESQSIHVKNDYATISEAMNAANPGDAMIVEPGTYSESIVMKPGVYIFSEKGPDQTIIAKNGITSLVTAARDAIFWGFTITDNNNGINAAGNGIYFNGDNMLIIHCIIKNNRTGIYLDNGSRAVIINNTIDNNEYAGIYMQDEPYPYIINNIITHSGTAGIFRNTAFSPGQPHIQHNDYYGNTQNYGYYGDTWSPDPGDGEMFEDPLFVGGTPFDYHLTAGSPCIDAGDTTVFAMLDPDGTLPDLGALYYDQPTFVDPEAESDVPSAFSLYPASPNPFNPVTTIKYSLPQKAEVTLTIYNIMGRTMYTPVQGNRSAGEYSVQWNGRNSQGQKLPSGVYFYRLEARAMDKGDILFTDTKKMILMK